MALIKFVFMFQNYNKPTMKEYLLLLIQYEEMIHQNINIHNDF